MTEVQDQSSSDIATQFSLIEQARANEPVAWEVVFLLYAPLIKRWARREGVTCPFEVDNVCQEVFIKIIKNLPSFQRRENGGSFRGWLRVITRNLICTQRLGKASPKIIGGSHWNLQLTQIPFNAGSANSLFDSVHHEDSEERALLFQRIMAWVDDHFSNTQQIAFKRVVIDQVPAREVAEELKVTPNIVYQCKSRILASIRQVFNDLV
jgi:RNA polymerase sigma-70 factor (ECF subfamily)